MEPCSSSKHVHKSMHAGGHKVEGQRPEGEECEEAEGLYNRSLVLMDGIRADVHISQLLGGSVAGEPCVADNDSGKTVYRYDGADYGEKEWRNEVRAYERSGRVEACWRHAPSFEREELHDERTLKIGCFSPGLTTRCLFLEFKNWNERIDGGGIMF